MAATGQSLDEMMAQLVGMGFEFDDAKDAIQAGKLCVTDAIEWIVAGKPAPAGGVLKLGQTRPEDRGPPIGSNPFSNPQPIHPAPPADSKPSASTAKLESDDQVVSRSKMSEEQQMIKTRFEQKQIDLAKRDAVLSKKSNKKAHQDILKRIQEDREQLKQRKAMAAKTGTAGQSNTPAAAGAAQPSVETPGHQNALLQIRLPDGRAIREKFPAEDTLQKVWDYVSSKVTCTNMILMQPFPKQDFGSSHMTQTLRELLLVPSGSLVLKPKETEVHQVAAEPEAQMEQEDRGQPLDEAAMDAVPEQGSADDP